MKIVKDKGLYNQCWKMKIVKSKYVNFIKLKEENFAMFHSYYGNVSKINKEVLELIEFFTSPNELDVFYEKYNIKGKYRNDVENIIAECMSKKVLLEYDKEMDELDVIKKDKNLYGYNERMLRFYVTPNCNMKCTYCFEGNHSPGLNMDFKTIINGLYAYKQFLDSEEDKKYNTIKVNFFGGEPLLVFDLIKKVYPYISQIIDYPNKNIKVTINTNATLLDKDKIDWIIQNNINLLVSVDGMRKQHDENRIFKDGKGTFDVVIKNLKLIIDNATEEYLKNKLSILVTISDKNINELNEVIDFLYEIGIKNVSLNAAFNCAVGKEKADEWTLLNEKEIDLFIQKVINLRNKMFEKDFHIGGMWGYIPQRIKKGGFTFCQALGYEIGVSAKGELYTCPCTFGKIDTSIGVLADKKFIFNDNYNSWKERTVINTPCCEECIISGICRGGCPGVSILNNDNIYEPKQCEFWKKFIISYIKILAEES